MESIQQNSQTADAEKVILTKSSKTNL
jgi:hypothetical protein